MKLYKRLSVLLSMGIMGIGLTTFSIQGPQVYAGTQADDKEELPVVYDDLRGLGQVAEIRGQSTGASQSDAQASVQDSGVSVLQPAPTPVPNRLTLISDDSDVYRLIRKYLDAKLMGTQKAFTGIVTDPSLIDTEYMAKRTEAVTGYDSLVCYTKHGYGSIDYVVFYTYEMDIVTIDTPLQSIDMVYVQYNEYGDPQVFVGELDDITSQALMGLIDDNDVNTLVDEAYSRMEEAMESDEGLRAFWERLNAAQ